MRVDAARAEGFPVVTLDVAPLDAEHGIIPGLKESDFSVSENGKAVPVRRVATLATIERAEVPILNVVFVLDNSITVASSRVKCVLTRLLDELRAGEDRAAIVLLARESDTSPEAISFGTVTRRVRARVHEKLTDDKTSIQRALEDFPSVRISPLFDGLVLAAKQVRDLPLGERAAIVVISDGCENNSLWSREEAISALREVRRPVFAVAVRPSHIWIPFPVPRPRNEELLRDLAARTGGRCFPLESDAEATRLHARILSGLNQAYRLTIESPNLDASVLSRTYEVALPGQPIPFTGAAKVEISKDKVVDEAARRLEPRINGLAQLAKRGVLDAEAAVEAARTELRGASPKGDKALDLPIVKAAKDVVKKEQAALDKIGKQLRAEDQAALAAGTLKPSVAALLKEIEGARDELGKLASEAEKLEAEAGKLCRRAEAERLVQAADELATRAAAATEAFRKELGGACAADMNGRYGEALAACIRARSVADSMGQYVAEVNRIKPSPGLEEDKEPSVQLSLQRLESARKAVAASVTDVASRALELDSQEFASALGLIALQPRDEGFRQTYLPRIDGAIRKQGKELLKTPTGPSIVSRYSSIQLGEAEQDGKSGNLKGAIEKCRQLLDLLQQLPPGQETAKEMAGVFLSMARGEVALALITEDDAARKKLLSSALDHMQRAKAPPSAEFHLNIGRAFLKSKLEAEAKTHLEKVVELDAGNVVARELLGQILYREALAGRAAAWGECSKHLELVAPQRPSNALALGRCYYELRKYAEAAAWCRKALNIPPVDPRAHLYLALSLFELGTEAKPQDVIEHCLKALEGKDLSALERGQAYACRGLTEHTRLDRWDAGIKWCLEAVRVAPDLKEHPRLRSLFLLEDLK